MPSLTKRDIDLILKTFNIENKRVLISLDSRSIGDTIAWAPYAIEFMKKYKCKVILSTFHNKWFKGLDKYKDIEFLEPGHSTQCYAQYKIGWYKNNDGEWVNDGSNLNICNLIPLQQTATDILGLEFKELNYGVHLNMGLRPLKEKYIVIGPQATSGCKEWVYDNWCKLASKFVNKGYKVFCPKGELIS